MLSASDARRAHRTWRNASGVTAPAPAVAVRRLPTAATGKTRECIGNRRGTRIAIAATTAATTAAMIAVMIAVMNVAGKIVS